MKKFIFLILAVTAAVVLVAAGISISGKRGARQPVTSTSTETSEVEEETLDILAEEELEADVADDSIIDEETAEPAPTIETEEDAAASALTTGGAAASTAPKAQSFTIDADDSGFYPSSSITVTRGARVSITFRVRAEGVYFNGLQVKSDYFSTGAIRPGASATVTFTAPDSTFTFTSYWPNSNVKKADGQVVVE